MMEHMRRAHGDESSPRVGRRHEKGGRRPPPRAGWKLRPTEGIQRAIMTIGEDQVVSYIDEDSQMIERMLQEKRLAGEQEAAAAVGGGGVVGADHGAGAADGVDPSLVVSALQSLLGKPPTEILPKCARSGDDFYSSEDGNDALAAGMFDLSVVCAELGAAAEEAAVPCDVGDAVVSITGDSGVESVEPLPSDAKTITTVTGKVAVASSNGSKRLSVGKVSQSVLDNYRPRTTSNAPEPDADEYRPRTTSKAPEPDTICETDEGTQPAASPAVVVKHKASIKVDDTYRPRTSSKAPEPESC
eukprot:m.162430 g.162430  ORF g.162430 m.162430 type:complete len:301 (-) comp12191_c0_seq1:477-1379(-)